MGVRNHECEQEVTEIEVIDRDGKEIIVIAIVCRYCGRQM